MSSHRQSRPGGPPAHPDTYSETRRPAPTLPLARRSPPARGGLAQKSGGSPPRPPEFAPSLPLGAVGGFPPVPPGVCAIAAARRRRRKSRRAGSAPGPIPSPARRLAHCGGSLRPRGLGGAAAPRLPPAAAPRPVEQRQAIPRTRRGGGSPEGAKGARTRVRKDTSRRGGAPPPHPPNRALGLPPAAAAALRAALGSAYGAFVRPSPYGRGALARAALRLPGRAFPAPSRTSSPPLPPRPSPFPRLAFP